MDLGAHEPASLELWVPWYFSLALSRNPISPWRKALKVLSLNLSSTAMAVASNMVETGRALVVGSDEHLHMVWKGSRQALGC